MATFNSVSWTLQSELKLSAAAVITRIDKTGNEVEVTAPRQFRELKCNAELRRKLKTLFGAR